MKEKEVISFRGNRDVWIDFTYKLRKDRKEVWDVLEKFIQNYLKESMKMKKQKNQYGKRILKETRSFMDKT